MDDMQASAEHYILKLMSHENKVLYKTFSPDKLWGHNPEKIICVQLLLKFY